MVSLVSVSQCVHVTYFDCWALQEGNTCTNIFISIDHIVKMVILLLRVVIIILVTI